VNATLENGLESAGNILRQLKNAGIDLDKVTRQLEKEGIEKFNQPFKKMMGAIAEKRKEK
jgi:transaldolase